MKVYSFEKLECWQQARQLAVWVYNATISFAAEEKFGLTSQMRRASVSIASNIAEGTSLNDLIIANDLKLLSDEDYLAGREKIEKQTLLITGLRKFQQKLSFRSFLNFLNF